MSGLYKEEYTNFSQIRARWPSQESRLHLRAAYRCARNEISEHLFSEAHLQHYEDIV